MGWSKFLLWNVVGMTIVAQLSGEAAFAEEPNKTSATYGAWTVRCSRSKDANVCEITQSLAVGKNRRVVAQLAIGQLPKAKAPRAVLRVPAGVDLTKAPVLLVGDKSQYQGRYFICAARFCRAEVDLPPAATDEIAKAKKISIRFIMLEKTIELPITIDGMAVALEKALKGTG
jgi:invasion protein IalB